MLLQIGLSIGFLLGEREKIGADENSSPPIAEVQTSTECEFDAFTLQNDSSLYYKHFFG